MKQRLFIFVFGVSFRKSTLLLALFLSRWMLSQKRCMVTPINAVIELVREKLAIGGKVIWNAKIG